jgi:hypothetical protein
VAATLTIHPLTEEGRPRLKGPKAMPVGELVAIRIVELAQAGEFDPDKLTEAVVAELDL